MLTAAWVAASRRERGWDMITVLLQCTAEVINGVRMIAHPALSGHRLGDSAGIVPELSLSTFVDKLIPGGGELEGFQGMANSLLPKAMKLPEGSTA